MSYSLSSDAKLILILIGVHYLQSVVFSFEKGLNGQNHSSLDSHRPIKNPPTKFTILFPGWEGEFFGNP